MSRKALPRVNFFDGMQLTETDLDVEQTAWHDGLANRLDFLSGSGVELEFADQRLLFDSDNVPSSVGDLITGGNFDGHPIYENDLFGFEVFQQPSDFTEGVQLEVQISGANLLGAFNLKVYIFGLIYGGFFRQEVLTFNDNSTHVTHNYFTEIVAIMTQDFKGNSNIIVDGVPCRNAGGRLRISEATPMMVVMDDIMAEQSVEPNMDYVNFKPSTMAKTLGTLLDEIADTKGLNADDLNINTTSTKTRELPPNVNGFVVGQKFLATTNNIQKVSLLLSVKEDALALPGHEYDWSGDVVVSVRKLQTTTRCPTDIEPGSSIEFEPEPYALAEISYDQRELERIGIRLTDTPQVLDFVFTQSLISNPSVEPNIEVDQHYIITVARAGNIGTGTLVLQEAANTDAGVNDTDTKRMTVFSQGSWVDIPDSDLWFKVYTNAIRIVNGTAYDAGIQVTLPKIHESDVAGVNEPYVEGKHSLIDVSHTTENYAIIQNKNNFTTQVPHPSTGNLIATRIIDAVDVSVVVEDTLESLIDAGNNTIVLGSARDTNPVGNPPITGTIDFPGLVRSNTFTVIQPSSDMLVNNLVGSILVPNINEPELKYRIIKQELYVDAYGDVNADGVVDLNDVARAQVIDGYSKTLVDGTLASVHQRNAIVSGTVTMEEIIRADVTNDGIINIYDPQKIQENIAVGSPFVAGSTFNRLVLTVDDLFDPKNITPNIVGSDSAFNSVPFSSVGFRVDFIDIWEPDNVVITDLRRFVPKTFTSLEMSDITGTTKSGGQNNSFLPGDLLLGGDFLATDGTYYPIDLEVSTIVFDLPEGTTQGEIDVFGNFIKDKMQFSDGTYVGGSALGDNQVRVLAAVQSFVKDTDGYDFESIDGYSAIQETVGVVYDQSSGLVRIRASNIRNLPTRPELRTKIVMAVYLKKAGFKNAEVNVYGSMVQGLLIPI
jgi:hypothetical protein